LVCCSLFAHCGSVVAIVWSLVLPRSGEMCNGQGARAGRYGFWKARWAGTPRWKMEALGEAGGGEAGEAGGCGGMELTESEGLRLILARILLTLEGGRTMREFKVAGRGTFAALKASPRREDAIVTISVGCLVIVAVQSFFDFDTVEGSFDESPRFSLLQSTSSISGLEWKEPRFNRNIGPRTVASGLNRE